MVTIALIQLLKMWKEKALELEGLGVCAENEQDQALFAAQVLAINNCVADLEYYLRSELLHVVQGLEEVCPDSPESPPQSPGQDTVPSPAKEKTGLLDFVDEAKLNK